jgi:dienelactone hydrolase
MAALLLAACGGGNNPGGSDGTGGDTSSRGELLQDPTLVKAMTADHLLDGIDSTLREALLLQAGTPTCDVNVYKVQYHTVGGQDEPTDASGALMVPSGTNDRCHGARPIVLYAHGTSTDRDFDLTNLDNQENAEGLYLAAYFAAQGYLVVAPNYAGYDTSSLPYHPYLVGDQQSKDMIDALTAARSALPVAETADTSDDGRLYVTGYSQGGYVAMATQRALEALGQAVTASAPMSGPYALAGFVDAVFDGRVNGGATVLGTFLFTTYQRVYGNVYDAPGDMFSKQYANGIESLLPSTKPRSQLYDEGLLPQRAFFDTVPPDPAYADVTPATTPDNLALVYARGFGTAPLITNAYRLHYLQDMAAHPDGGWPDTTTAEPPEDAGLGLRQDLANNDLRNWTPQVPTLLCGGHDDPTVFWLNTQLMQAYWAQQAPEAAVTFLDVDAASTGAGDPYDDLKRRFAIAKSLVETTQGETAMFELYHAGLVAPFCLEAAQEFFEAH